MRRARAEEEVGLEAERDARTRVTGSADVAVGMMRMVGELKGGVRMTWRGEEERWR